MWLQSWWHPPCFIGWIIHRIQSNPILLRPACTRSFPTFTCTARLRRALQGTWTCSRSQEIARTWRSVTGASPGPGDQRPGTKTEWKRNELRFFLKKPFKTQDVGQHPNKYSLIRFDPGSSPTWEPQHLKLLLVCTHLPSERQRP